ncbi:MAG: ABC transporter substrate-binding protein [Halobacteriales archaeon]|nr:ABC transporter substrate-binding protein [Halobacteriales archaeon]
MGEPNASGTVKIGVLQPISGDLQYYGQQGVWGFSSGLRIKAGEEPSVTAESGSQTVTVGDVDYELYIRDTQFSADNAQSLATNLVTGEDVDMLFGCASSGAATRVVETVAKQAGVPYMMGPAASASATATAQTCGEQIFRASENTAMDARSGGKYVARESDVSRVFLFGADLLIRTRSRQQLRVSPTERGCRNRWQAVCSTGLPAGWEGLLDNAVEAGAEGIVGGFTVATLPALFTSYLRR